MERDIPNSTFHEQEEEDEDSFQWVLSEDPDDKKLDKDKLIQCVLDRCTPRLVEDMCPLMVLDRFLQDDICTFVKLRDITELKTTSEKNRAIRECVRKRPHKYVKFKEILRDTRQPYLAEYLGDKERNIHNQMKDLGYQCVCTEDEYCGILTELHIDLNIVYTTTSQDSSNISNLRDLQNSLVEIYKSHYCHLPINPITPEVLEPLSSLYVKPTMRVVDKIPRVQDFDANKININSLRDVFLPTTEQSPKQIYIKGEAGTGKTAFCKHVITIWCQMVEKLSKNEQMNDDEHVMSNFDLVFYITLKDFNTFIDIKDMVKHFLNRDVSVYLKEWRCLIILDGLDDWTKPVTHSFPVWATQGVPIQDYQNRWTVLTTTRPWKLVYIKPISTDIDHLIEIWGISEEQQHEIVHKLLSVLVKGKTERAKNDISEFFTTLQTTDFETLAMSPAILKMLFCLWFGYKEIGKIYLEAHINLLERFLELTSQRYKESTSQLGCEEAKLPSLDSKRYCKQYLKQLKEIGYLAYQIIVSKAKESPKEDIELQNCKSTDSIEFGLNTGLLTKSERFDNSLEKECKMNFVYKPFQAILAALYISVSSERVLYDMFDHWDTIDKVLEIENVLVLLCGLDCKLCGKITSIILTILDKDKDILNYRLSSVKIPTQFRGSNILKMQNLVAKLAQESSKNDNSVPNARIYDMIVSEQFSQCTLSYINTRFLKSVCVKTDTLETLNAKDGIYSSFFEKVTDALQLQKIHIDDSRKVLNVTCIFGLICQSFSTISCLCLEWVNLNELGENFSQVLGKMSLKSLSLRYVKLTHKQLENLQMCINKHFELIELELTEVRCSDCLPLESQYSIMLNEDIQLRRLCLSGLDVQIVQVSLHTLASLEIGYLGNDAILKDLFKGINTENRVTELIIAECVDTKSLVEILRRLTNLETLRISRTDFGENTIMVPNSVTSISLDTVTISRKNTIALLENIESLDHRVHVDMFKVASEKDLSLISHILGRMVSKFVILKGTNKEISFYTNKHL